MCVFPYLHAHARAWREGEGHPPGPWWGRRSLLHLPRVGGGRGGGWSSRPQLDTLEDKSPPSPSHLRFKISSYHHVNDWVEEGKDHVPSPASSPPQAKRRREEREWGTDRSRAPDFQEKSARRRSPTRERPQPHGHNRRAAPACPRSPPLRALPGGDSRIHWGLIRLYHEQTEFGEDVSRPLDQTVHPNSVANSVWQRAKAHNRSCERNQMHRPDHTCARIIRWTLVTARGLGPINRGTLQRGLHQPALTIARLNRPDTRNRAITARCGMT